MKKFLILALMLVLSFSLFAMAAPESPVSSANRATAAAQKDIIVASTTDVPIPQVDYFQERRTIAKWTERWDAPNIPTFVYLISYGNIIGYYVADGKPASTRSYLLPEERMNSYNGNPYLISTPDIDGTYGDNNPGIRFFTAEGVAVEWAGSGASYLYSDAPLPINVPKLNPVR